MNDRKNILQVVEKYIESAYTSDGNLVRDIFHEDSKVTGHIKGKLLSGNKKDGYKLSKDAQKVLDFHRKTKDKYPLPWDEKTLNNPEFQKLAKESGFSMTTAKGRMKLMVYTNYLLYTNELKN